MVAVVLVAVVKAAVALGGVAVKAAAVTKASAVAVAAAKVAAASAAVAVASAAVVVAAAAAAVVFSIFQPAKKVDCRSQSFAWSMAKKTRMHVSKYEIKPIEAFAKNEASAEVLKMMADGEIHRDIAQACAWHLENGLSWEELASKDKVVSSFGGYSEKYFSLKQISFRAESLC